MARRNLLLCFDAFGTLFTPKQPVSRQYADVARSVGIIGFTDNEVDQAFRAAFQHESRHRPNYGKASGLNATRWWTAIVQRTFEPLVGPDERITRELAPRLMYRFGTEEAYEICADARRLLQHLRRRSSDASDSAFGRIAVGVVTNSDDRVPNVLISLGLRVSQQRYRATTPEATGRSVAEAEAFDVDFCVMSYDVGVEKPDPAIFAAAEEVLAASPLAQDTTPSSWDRVYVGDDYDKDVQGAMAAGWRAVYVNRDESGGEPSDVTWLGQGQGSERLLDCFPSSGAIGVRSLDDLARRLPRTE